MNAVTEVAGSGASKIELAEAQCREEGTRQKAEAARPAAEAKSKAAAATWGRRGHDPGHVGPGHHQPRSHASHSVRACAPT